MGKALAADAWVVDGNYFTVRNLVWERADTLVWFDLPRPVVMRRVVMRTLRRALTREQPWNGTREPLSNFYRWDPQKNVIRWAWDKFPEYSERYGLATKDPPHADIRFVRLTAPHEVEAVLAQASP